MLDAGGPAADNPVARPYGAHLRVDSHAPRELALITWHAAGFQVVGLEDRTPPPTRRVGAQAARPVEATPTSAMLWNLQDAAGEVDERRKLFSAYWANADEAAHSQPAVGNMIAGHHQRQPSVSCRPIPVAAPIVARTA